MATAKQMDFLLVGLHKTDGSINSSGVVTFFESGTTTPKSAYDGPNTETDNAITSITLDSTGKATVFGNGTYRLVIKDSDGATIGTYDGMQYAVSSDTLNNVVSITNSDSPYTASTSNHTIQANATSGAITVNLPTAVGNGGRTYYIKKTDSSGNAVTIDPNGAQTIDGSATVVLATQYANIFIESDGSNWTIIQSSASLFIDSISENTVNAGITFGSIQATGVIRITSGAPVLFLEETGGTAEEGKWQIVADGDGFNIRLISDDELTAINAISVVRTGVVVDTVIINGFRFIENAPDPTSWPSFLAHRNGSSQNSITGDDQIEFNNDSINPGFDLNADYNTSTFRFIPTAAGKYLLTAQILFSSITVDDVLQISIKKNGALIGFQSINAGSSDTTLQTTIIVNANGSSDYFEVFGQNTNRDTSGISGQTAQSYFCGTRIA